MGIFIIDFSAVTDKESLFEMLERVLRLPEYFSHNLDSLSECLGDFNQNNVIILEHEDHLVEVLGDYGRKLLYIFDDNSYSDFPYVLIRKK